MRVTRPFLAVGLLAAIGTSCAPTVAPASGTGTEAASSTAAPAGDVAAVRAVVQRLFDGMRARDTVMMGSVFHPEARFYGLNREGAVEMITPSAFMQGIGRAPAGLLLDEVIQDVEVRIDGNLATVWTYYDFFAGDRFSHCGYDAFQLLKSRTEWKIVALADSRRTEGCRQKRS
jgi:Putative lumazine-binding